YKDTFTVPAREFVADGESYAASAVVYYPDGTTAKGDQVSLNQVGIYTVKYSAQAGDKVFASSESFLVNYPAYSVSAEKSSISYGTPARATTEGVMARVAQGDSLTFTKYIDFTQVSMDEYLVKGFVTPDTSGAMDFAELVITFTDSVDESVWFSVHYYGYDWAWNTYVAAGGHNQLPNGVHQSEGLKTPGSGYGLWSYIPFNSKGQTQDGSIGVLAPDASQFFVSMNYAEKQLYAPGFISTTVMFMDLDDTSDTDGSIKYVDNAWTGFPSGKARLSVSASGLNGATANFCITEVCGISGEELKNNLYIDSDKPTVTVDEAFDESMPTGLVGYDYTIPAATAYDAYARDCEVKATVWYNYGLNNAVNVPVKDGKFTVDKAGTYAIEYIARDAVGNESKAVRWVRAFDEIADATFEIPADKTTAAVAGEWVTVPVIDGKSVVGGSGTSTIVAYVEFDGKREVITDGFRALNVGMYKVIYAATDYVDKTVEKSYDVTVTAGTKPILERDYDLYPIYISDQTYALPEFYAYYYDGGKLEKNLCDVVITDGNGTHSHKAGDRVKISVKNQADPISFEIKSEGVTLVTHKAVGALAWVNEAQEGEEEKLRLHVENYLIGEGFVVEREDGGMLLTAANGDFGFTFANALSARQMNMKLALLAGTTADTRITVVLSDVLNQENNVSATVLSDGGKVYLEANGTRRLIPGAVMEAGEFTIEYENNAFTVNGVSVDVSDLVAFETDKVFLNVAVTGSSENATVRFIELGNCLLTMPRTDRVAPVLYAPYETGGRFLPNTQYTLSAPICYDVYAPNLNYSLTVEGVDGKPIKDVNGVLLENVDPTKDYVIDLKEIGQYLVKYLAVETDGFASSANEADLIYTLTVADKVAPEI
ncbi:MAG: hypothetical protein J6A46_03550, partial [Clostridia bacterium]|nr:hypothetical protein [Clostridia bacterium]